MILISNEDGMKELKRLKKEMKAIKQILEKIPEQDIVKSIREDREQR